MVKGGCDMTSEDRKLLEHADTIKKYCENHHNCVDCIFYNKRDIVVGCEFLPNTPDKWKLGQLIK